MAIIWDIGFQKEQLTEEEIEAIVDEAEEQLEKEEKKSFSRGFGN